MVKPLSAHDFDTAVITRVDFDPRGLIVAERDGQLVGFAHAGFGPVEPNGPTHRLDRQLGTVAMLVVDPAVAAEGVADRLLAEAEAYLRERGAQVLYAGGRFPLDPFYRSVYGGSEWSGILDDQTDFRQAVEAAGYAVAARASLLELDLAQPEVRDPRAVVLRRQARFDVIEDVDLTGWWDGLAIGQGAVNGYQLIRKTDDLRLAEATTWDMTAFGKRDGQARVGLIALAVAPTHRRQGFGRFLITEVARHLREHWADAVAVATDQTNTAALALYHSLGFDPVGSATLYRKPGG